MGVMAAEAVKQATRFSVYLKVCLLSKTRTMEE